MCSSSIPTREQAILDEKLFKEENRFLIPHLPTVTFFPKDVKNFDLELQRYFPERFDRWVIIALYVAVTDTEEGVFVAVSSTYLERLSTTMRYQHVRQMWVRLWKYLISFGKVTLFDKRDLIAFFIDPAMFRIQFWSSLRAMITDGLIEQEVREMEDEKTNIYYPSKKLIERLSAIVE